MTPLLLHNGSKFIDQTGMTVLKYTEQNSWQLLQDNPNFLPHAQDTRIYKKDEEILISFNDDSKKGFPIRYCKLDIKPFCISVSNEKDLIKNSYKLDKNCTIVENGNIQYDFINGQFSTIQNNVFVNTELYHFEQLKKLYKNQIYFSVSSPAIPYTENTFLSIGHVKINYHSTFFQDPDLNEFINNASPQYHNKYIYMMFFYEFSKDYKVERLSMSFIPNFDGNESYLVFPCGLFEYNQKFHVTYGEDDIKTKIAIFDRQEIETLLEDNQLYMDSFKCGFLEKESIDVTDLIPSSSIQNCFVFNNSMIHWKEDLFIMMYRLVYIDSENEFNNPLDIWQHIWDNENWNPCKKFLS